MTLNYPRTYFEFLKSVQYLFLKISMNLHIFQIHPKNRWYLAMTMVSSDVGIILKFPIIQFLTETNINKKSPMWYFFEMGGVEGRISLFDTQLFQLLINPAICTSRDTTYFWDRIDTSARINLYREINSLSYRINIDIWYFLESWDHELFEYLVEI